MNGQPDISIVIPVWNREESLVRALDSLPRDASNRFEVIVVDDGSTDNSRAVAEVALAEWPNAQVIQQQNAGAGAARNAGAALARGKYIAFLDSDDHWFHWTADCCVEAVAVAGGSALIFLRNLDFAAGTLVRPPADRALKAERFSDFSRAVCGAPTVRFATCNVMIRRDVFEAIGGFSSMLRCSEDTDLFLRVPNDSGCTVVQAPALVAHEIGGNDSLTGNFDRIKEGVEFLLKRERSGRYPASGEREVKRVLAKTVSTVVLRAFAGGRTGTAYAFYLRHLPRLLQGREWHWLFRLPLIPLLHMLRPKNFAFRFRPE